MQRHEIEHKMIQPHLNPAIDAHMRFRLKLQVENVRRLVVCSHSVWSVSYCPAEVRRYRQCYPYGWQVADTTLDNLFREHKVPWDDEDEEKNASREKNIAAITQREDDNLAPAREGGPQGGQHQLQGIAQASERLVEGEKGQSPEKGCEGGGEGGGSSP